MVFFPIPVQVDFRNGNSFISYYIVGISITVLTCIRNGRGDSLKGDSSHSCACTCTFMGYFSLHLLQRW